MIDENEQAADNAAMNRTPSLSPTTGDHEMFPLTLEAADTKKPIENGFSSQQSSQWSPAAKDDDPLLTLGDTDGRPGKSRKLSDVRVQIARREDEGDDEVFVEARAKV